ncbi:MAG TPA: HAMP domain-containing sensor histidine kinase [Caulobacteraceae bacterium]|jgi:signal transduction histidine kinase
MFGSITLRLAAVYTAVFALAVAAIGAGAIAATHAALVQQLDRRLSTEADAIAADYAEGGRQGLLDELEERRGAPGELSFGVQTVAGAPVAGPLARLNAPAGLSAATLVAGGRRHELRLLSRDLPGGYRLLAGGDTAILKELTRDMTAGFALAFVAVIVVGAGGGLAFSRQVGERLSAISGTAEAIIDGDLSRRIPVVRAGDDLARLALTINRMLDRIQALMESFRQVSSDVAHDLRTPLSRLRQKLEQVTLETADKERRSHLESALEDVDALLSLFAAVLRIAQMEAGAGRSVFRRADLAELAHTVFEAYRPSAEELGKTLALEAAAPGLVEGDPELLVQLMANLIENALAHTPPGARIVLAVQTGARAVSLSVRDDGPGVPSGERGRIFDRFYRLERSRSSPGSGLGLALVAAIGQLHRAQVQAIDARPGLEVRVTLPAAV